VRLRPGWPERRAPERVLTPAGITQADELDYTLHSPVTIAPVVVP
jgi:hypothetical protein